MSNSTQWVKKALALAISSFVLISIVSVAAVTTAAATSLESADRTVTETAAPGETVTVTVSGQLNGDTQTLTISESFSPKFADVSLESYSLDGEPVSLAEPTITEFNTDGVDFVHDGEGEAIASSSFELVYAVEVVDEEATHELVDGSVTATDPNDESESISLEPASISVSSPIQLDLNVNQTEVNASESVLFTVTENDTGEPISNATVALDDSEAVVTTGPDGTATFSFQGTGEINSTATKSATDSQTYIDSSSVSISISPDPGDKTSKYREPDTGDVEVDGLREGIDDFTAGETDLEVLRQLITEFTGR